jgi:hypothetical protein
MGGDAMKILKPHGPRGVMLLGFVVISTTICYAYLQPGAGRGLTWFTAYIPISWLAILSGVVGVWLLVSAFRIKQSRALSAFSGLCFLWGTLYAVPAVIAGLNGTPPTGISLVGLYYGLTITCGAAVRMINPARSHMEVIEKPGPRRSGKDRDRG